jgi:hypothetical protein
MVVIAHQAVRMATPIEPTDSLIEHVRKVRAVRLIFMDRLTAITTRRLMVERTAELAANGSSHMAAPTPPNAAMPRLTQSCSS